MKRMSPLALAFLLFFALSVRSTAGVEVGRFGARPGTNSVVLRWVTQYEVNRVGFNVYRTTRLGGPMMQVNEDLIPSLVEPGSMDGASYQYTDSMLPRPGTYYYWLEIVGADGDSELYGPIVAFVSGGLGKKLHPVQSMNGGQIWN